MAKRATSANAGKTAAHRASKSTASRVLTYAPPWVAWIIVLPLSAVAYVTWGRNPVAAPWMSMAAFALVAALVPFTWRVLRPRDEVLQWMGTVSAGLGGFWFIVGMLVGPLTRGVIDAWGFGGFGICVFWTIRRMVVNGAAEQQAEAQESKLDKVLAGAKVFKPKEIEGRVVAQMEVNRGEQTVRDLQGSADKMAGALGVRPGAVRIAADPEDAGRAELVIVPNDPLVGEIVWPGPSAPGASIADAPIPIGVYEDGEVASIYLCGDDSIGRALAHWLVMGMNGAGKSAGWTNAMVDALTRYDFELWGSDHVKGAQTFGPLQRYMAKVATTVKGAKQLFAEARDEASRRFAELGERGIQQWEKDCGFPLLLVWIEEASEVVSDSTSFVRLVERARSAGVVIVASLQRASHDNIDTSARAQLAGALCFGVRDAMDATFALPDNVLDAGATPDNWGNRKPGYCYLVAPGVDEERWPVPLRTFRARNPQLVAVLDEWATPLRAEVSGPAATSLVSNGLEGEVVDREDMDADDGEDGMEPIPPTLEPELKFDADEPIAPPTEQQNLAFATSGGPKLNTDQARAVVQQHLRTLAEQGFTQTQPAHVCQMKPATTRSREWVRQELNRLCEQAEPGEIALEREVSDVPGVYRIVAPSLAGVR
ncbi:hypothetical protein PSN13_06480 [Micromonospora saelicesensis]|uniref:FtsK domain-containing protein n=1 Tax=Micromonospora saelicesensis TaxID=285676 RepID=A0A328NF67_9ACTN|nr:hypothetical protein [Micromonospora saelicesensis]RAO26452.1 hypothetical protein PSN13_06480 [Micromonospora saelicesensis]